LTTRGFLYLTGLLWVGADEYFLLRKYFLQILAGVTNTDTVSDPAGFITHSKALVVIPSILSEGDIESTVILPTDIPAADSSTQTPAGVIRPSNAAAVGVKFLESGTTSYYHYALPVVIGSGARAGVGKCSCG